MELTNLAQDMEAANAAFAQFAQNRTDALTRETEDSLKAVWSRMVFIGCVCLVVFLWLAFLISRGIHSQVRELDEARAEAESGRQTTHKLMLEQQAAAAKTGRGARRSAGQRAAIPNAQRFGAAGNLRMRCRPASLCMPIRNGNKSPGCRWRRASAKDGSGPSTPMTPGFATNGNAPPRNGEDFIREFRFRSPSGEIRWVSATSNADPFRIRPHPRTRRHRRKHHPAQNRPRPNSKTSTRNSWKLPAKPAWPEIATGVLHNVGNVLNSVNISSSVVAERLKKSGIGPSGQGGRISCAITRLTWGLPHQGCDRQSNCPPSSRNWRTIWPANRQEVLKELAHLQKNIEHIKEIVSTQQAYASSAGLSEMVDLHELVEDALRIHHAAIMRHDISVVKELANGSPRSWRTSTSCCRFSSTFSATPSMR